MNANKIVYSIIFLLIFNKSILTVDSSRERLDIEAHHPEVLIEDLANLTDTDLEFKDDDQLEHLLMVIDDELKNIQNDFEGQFNIPEITDHEPGTHFVGPYSKTADLHRMKQKISNILSEREEEA